MSVLTNLQGIIAGYKNYTFPSETMEKIARERALVCALCSHCNPDHPFKRLMGDGETIEEIKGMGCSLCNCLLSVKTRQLFSDCPAGRWDKNLLTTN